MLFRSRSFGQVFIKNLSLLSLLILLPTLIIGSITAVSVSAFMKNEITAYSYKSLGSYKYLTDSLISDYIAWSYALITDSDVELFLMHKSNSNPYYESKAIHEQIRSQMQIRDYLESIYIYSENCGLILSSFGESPIDEFFDQDWLSEYEANTIPSRFWCTFRTGPNLSLIHI